MNRRSTDVDGWVNFPVNDPRWVNSNQGGMFVKLVVVDPREFDDQFGVCTGVGVYDMLQECLVGDDLRPKPVSPSAEDCTQEDWEEYDRKMRKWEEYHFPHINAHLDGDQDEYFSRVYLCSMVLGSTGWSGWSEEHSENWTCKYDDLTEQGKALYNQIKQLYPGCDLHLLTFLDT
jgi:hypothetical protein